MKNDNRADQGIEKPDVFSGTIGTTEELIQRYTHCSLCAARLHFAYLTDFGKQVVHENAKCPECGSKSHSVLHRLQ